MSFKFLLILSLVLFVNVKSIQASEDSSTMKAPGTKSIQFIYKNSNSNACFVFNFDWLSIKLLELLGPEQNCKILSAYTHSFDLFRKYNFLCVMIVEGNPESADPDPDLKTLS